MKRTAFLLLLAIIGKYGLSTAQMPSVVTSDRKGWHKIGETTVDFKKDRDEVAIIGADRFAAIQFRVKDAPIDLQDLEVYYESGDKQDIQVRTPIRAQNSSRVIDLNGGERNLKKIVFVYKTLPNSKDERAQVEIYGLKTNTDEMKSAKANTNNGTEPKTIQEPGVIMNDKSGWHKIGERSVNFSKDRDEILVIGADRFTALKFKVTEAPINLMDLEVYYESGDKQDISVRSPIMAGTESKIINLTSGERGLKKVVFVYQTLPNRKDEKALVEVWGLKTNIAVK